ncbi:MAG: LysR family transcriptional regulator [Rhodobacteraceae bacterium]|nr:LysR family transcriptional regulator [Paracoccaceae bacterium]
MEQPAHNIAGSLNALLVLEVAVRHSSLSRAAKELGLSQPAVSRHISTLEGRLGQPLFQRNNNRIVPTPNAQRLADAVALGLGHVDQTWVDISAPPDRGEITLACTFGFADQWLMPRFSDLRAHMGDTRVRVVTTDQLGAIDLSWLDVAVVWDVAATPDRPYFPLIRDEAFPICSPAFLARHPEACEDLSRIPADVFLHFDTGRSGFLTWNAWFARVGLKPPKFGKSTEFDAYPFLLQSVRRGEGIGLGWTGLVDQALEDGEVLRLGPTASSREASYYVQHRPFLKQDASLQFLLDWFRANSNL